ncbi:hypothetical protein NL676_003331 [Syzygium grande]|nr:hypothetical protein NL676_003331 [Syzygium grande]
MEGINKFLMSSFFLPGLFLIVPGTAAQTDTSDMKCAAPGADLSACVKLFSVGAEADLGNDVTPPRRCCTGLQQIKASVAVLGALRTCQLPLPPTEQYLP